MQVDVLIWNFKPNCIWKCHLQNVSHVVQATLYYTTVITVEFLTAIVWSSPSKGLDIDNFYLIYNLYRQWQRINRRHFRYVIFIDRNCHHLHQCWHRSISPYGEMLLYLLSLSGPYMEPYDINRHSGDYKVTHVLVISNFESPLLNTWRHSKWPPRSLYILNNVYVQFIFLCVITIDYPLCP